MRVITNYGEFWYNKNKELHRDEDLPAVISKCNQIYYKNGKISRDENKGPAVIANAETMYKVIEYRLDGLLHRLNGPASIAPRLTCYYIYGKLSRLDGPAWIGDEVRYFINNIELSHSEWLRANGKFTVEQCVDKATLHILNELGYTITRRV